MKLPVYLDYNATTPCDKEVVNAMLPYFTESFGNAASRAHQFGWRAEAAVDLAREQVAQLIGADKSEVIFTSGATEGCNLALKGVYEMFASKGNHIITSTIEHKAVLDTCKHLEKLGAEVTYLEVGKDGLVDLNALENAITPKTILISLMYANNEIGVIQPAKEIGKIAKKHGVLFFSDATQAVGKIGVNVQEDEIDLMTLSAHKLYGPKGVGALYVRRRSPRVKLAAQIDGGGHEKGMRSGTLNVPGIVGLGKACDLCRNQVEADANHTGKLRDQLEKSLLTIEGTYVNGSRIARLPNTTNIAFESVDGNALLMGFQKDIAVSSGSACTSASLEPSYVLKAIGMEDELARSSLRFSLGRYTTGEEIEYVAKRVKETVQQLRQMNPFYSPLR